MAKAWGKATADIFFSASICALGGEMRPVAKGRRSTGLLQQRDAVQMLPPPEGAPLPCGGRAARLGGRFRH